MSCRHLLPACLLLTLMLTGCGQGDTRELAKAPWVANTAKWPELENLLSGPTGGLQRAFRMSGGTQMVPPGWLSESSFAESLQKFESTPIPSEYATPEREAHKTELVALIKKLQAASGGPSKEVAKQVRRTRYLYEKILYIPGQTPPQGTEAAKYSVVIPPVEPVEPDVPVAKK